MTVALGIGAAVMTGWQSGLAWADETDGAVGSTSSSTTDTKADPSDKATEAADPPNKDTDETPPTKPLRKKRSAAPAAKPKPKPTTAASAASDVKHAAPAVAKQEDTTAVPNRLSDPTQSSVASSRATISTPATPKPVQPNMVRAVTAVVSGVVNAILSPFAASSTPGAPAEGPSIWSLLAFARREFERAFTTPSLSDKPVDTQHTSQTTEQRTLILSAFPAETDAILARTTLDPNPSVVVGGHHFYLGTLGGKKVIVAMTGIGMVNATQTTEIALDHFTGESGISIGAVVFSGVAGGSGRTEIGDVAVPARWTSDDGQTWHAVDPGMLATASALDVDLLSRDSIGDPNCYCGLFAGPQIDLKREPDLVVGGDGSSDDNNNGTAFPALPSIPFVGDIFGAQPCAAPDFSLLFTGNFFQAIVPFLAFGLVSNLTGLLSPATPAVDAVDQETAAAQQVADAHGIPFLGIRGMSDGPGDPLNLPGYPFTFAVYKQIAADNAAIVAEAFLQNWDGA
ncbi:nucleoside phosphorylase [Mycobacterium sp. OAS707]|uniref:5'-methylthioadenosine/S-adenosylhomocysteine nucleosidase family protein n=1 Tax=Mycobacterium sp. OAS707 TaxID=2663822 RepID=UPI0019EA485F|nr:5'-methylthioadenosine/S-adenosylhomocysteine nucleosidase [Mycobacterium sp. OAS707]MBE1552746.1 nucleoside phosphorylase [Mycobacterium sp. OAS707]